MISKSGSSRGRTEEFSSVVVWGDRGICGAMKIHTNVDGRLVVASVAQLVASLDVLPVERAEHASVAKVADLDLASTLCQATGHQRSAVKAACAGRGEQQGNGKEVGKHDDKKL